MNDINPELNINDLKNIANEVNKSQTSRNTIKNKKVTIHSPPIIKHIGDKNTENVFPKLEKHPNSDQKTLKQFDAGSQYTVSSDPFYNIAGFSIPTETLYLFLILLAISIGVWYMTNDSKKTDKINKNDEE